MRYRFSYIAKLTLVLILFFPVAAQAACSADGYTVVFINGIRTNEAQASDEKEALKRTLGTSFNSQPLTTILGYNESHLAGAGDVVETVLPQFTQYDVDTILMQMHDQVTTRKLLVVGYSEGAMLANELYDYLVAHGEPKDAVGVYAIATPAPTVAGGGKYLNYQGDTVIYNPSLQVGAVVPPPPNITVKDWWDNASSTGENFGHDLIAQYLANFSDRIASDIDSELYVLRPTDATTTGSCFEAPSATLGYQTEHVALDVADPLAAGIKATTVAGYQAAAAVVGTTHALASAVGGAVAGLFGSDKTPDQKAADDRGFNDAGFALVKAVMGSSLDVSDFDELQREYPPAQDLGGAVALAIEPQQPAPADAEPAQPQLPQPDAAPAPIPAVPITQLFAAPIAGAGGGAPDPSAPAADAQDSQQDANSQNDQSATSTDTGDATSTDTGSSDTGDTASSTDDGSASSTPTLTQAELFAANPPVITFANWDSPPITDTYCTVDDRTADVSWSPVPNATHYKVWQDINDTHGYNATDTQQTSLPDTEFEFGLNWAGEVMLEVHAYDADGDEASSSVSVNDADPDHDSPYISIDGFSPPYNSFDVPIDTPISLTYNEALNPSTVTTSNFTLAYLPPDERPFWVPVATTVSLDADGHTVHIAPLEALEPGSRYDLAASCDVKDLYGNHAAPLTWDNSFNFAAFTTADAPVDTGDATSSDDTATSTP